MRRRLADMRQREEALEKALEQVARCRELAEQRTADSLHDLLDGLLEHSVALLGLRREEESLAVVQESVALCRLLEQEHPGAGAFRLAMLLLNAGMLLCSQGREEEALAGELEAVGLLRRLMGKAPDRVLPFLADAVHSLGLTQDRVGKGEEALASLRESVGLHRELVEKNAEDGLKNLAEALSGVARQLRKLGRKEEALLTELEEVALYRELEARDPGRFRGVLALHLELLSDARLELGQREEALALLGESGDLYALEGEEESCLWARARVLVKTGELYRELGQHPEALAAEEDEADVCRRLSERCPLEYARHLWRSLCGDEGAPGGMGRERCEALLARVEDMVDRFRRRAPKRQEFVPALAKALAVLGRLRGELGLAEAALAPAREAVELHRAQLEEDPLEGRAELAVSLRSLAERLAALGRNEEALPLAEESLAHAREVDKDLPSDFTGAEVAACLSTLGAVQRALGH